MAANTDLLKKLSRRWVGQIGSGGVADASVTTIPFASTTNLPTDTAVVFTIDRVDANGTATPSLEETGIGVVSGSNLVTCTRGVEGTAQAHSAGAVVEILVTAKGYNDLIDHLLVQHNQLGYHTNITACNITASGTQTLSHVTASDVTARMLTLNLGSDAQGDIYYRNTSTVARLGPGISGQFLKTQGASANPVWADTGATDGWVSDSNTWTYSSVDGATGVVTINADLTGVIQAGDRIKFTQTTVKYFIVTKTPTFGGGNTTLTFWGGTDYTLVNAAITSPSYSHVKSPFGFNTDPTKWTIRVTDSTDRSQASAVAGTWYNLGTTAEQITIHIGTWDVYYNVNLQQNTAAVIAVFCTLSTANNTESDSELSVNVNSVAAFAGGAVTKRKTITNTSKTTHYLNTSTSSAATPTIYNRNSVANGSVLIIEARCAYL